MATTDPQNIAPPTVTAIPETAPPPAPPVTATDAADYAVLEPLMHDGQVYGAGDTVSLSAKQAKTLLASGVVKKGK